MEHCRTSQKEASIMPIKFDKLTTLLKKQGISLYKLKADKVIGTATLDKIRKGVGHIDTRSIESICQYLQCQPGDIMEYVSDERDVTKVDE